MSEPVPLRPIWLASYPRSGNTFLRILLQNVFHLPTFSLYRIEGEEYPDPSAETLDEAPYLPRDWQERLTANAGTLTLIKTHDPPQDDAPAMVLVRDGRAAVDSYYHYHQKFAFEKPSLTEVIAGACQFGGWSQHYLAWQPRQRPNTLLLRYEELVSRPTEVIPRIATFLNVQPSAGTLPTFGELQARFPGFFRRGCNEDFLQKWTPGQMALFNGCHGAVMKELGYSLTGTEAILDTAVELARSSARLHRLYLEQLSRLGAAAASQQRLADQLTQAGRQIQELCAKVEEKDAALRFLWSRRWVKLGKKLRMLEKRNGNGGGLPALVPKEESKPARP